ncbi:MAG: hypothetical protein KF862_00765 [Chitinophagaceae bacterium]|nr:hypothetical protein [Chitinophagaceae bacterium]
MCKTSKSSQSAAANQLPDIQPKTGGGGPSTPADPPVVTIRREHVPEIVFIAEASANDNGFIASANSFHDFFGFRSAKRKTFTSLQHLVQLLAATDTALNRIRIVAHADNTGIFSPFVQGAPRVTIEKGDLRVFLEGDGKWLHSKLNIFHFLGSGAPAREIAERILSHILQSSSAPAVTPFGYTESSHPDTALITFVLCAATPLVVNGNFLKKDTNTNLSAAQKTAFITAFDKILDVAGSNLRANSSFSSVTPAHLTNLKTVIRNFSLADYNFTPGITPISDDFLNTLSIHVAALTNKFRENLAKMQQRFSGTSWVDIRGCRAGTDRDYLTAVSEFFGKPGSRPHVSGPTWYQMFPGIGSTDSPGAESINEVLTTGNGGISADDYKSNLDKWLTAVRYNDAYFNAWHTAFNSKAAFFCQLNWRANIPTTFMIREGKQHGIASLNFIDTIKRIKSIMGVSASAHPTQAILNTLQTFVSTKLPGYMQQLTQAVPATGPFTTIFNALKTISDELSASVVPATAPAGLTSDQVKQYQTQLIDFISTNKLQRIHELLQNAQTHVNGPNGKYHLFLRFGLPGIVFIENDFLISKIFVLTSEKNNALRIFLREMWEEALPTPNSVGTASLDTPAHRAISTLTQDHSDTTVHLAPMPNYFDHIETI